MRLINTSTFQFEEFKRGEDAAGNYAILSHRWSDSEVNYEIYSDLAKHLLESEKSGMSPQQRWEIVKDRFRSIHPQTDDSGLSKIWWGCWSAEREQLKYFWIDTCCINKDDTNKLNSSIRLMFKWY